jgi:hypothetical protein
MTKAKQLTWSQANAIAETVAPRSTGFTKVERGKSYTVTGDELLKVLENAAHLALRAAGCLTANDARDRARNDRLAAAAEKRHRAWCEATGHTH